MTIQELVFVTCLIVGAISAISGLGWLVVNLLSKRKLSKPVTLLFVGIGLVIIGWILFQNAFSSEYHF